MLFTGLLFSVLIECQQFIIILGFRSTDIYDVILNTIGISIGYLTVRLTIRFYVLATEKLRAINLNFFNKVEGEMS
jgi:glycopeptide antibiotics resistance protein